MRPNNAELMEPAQRLRRPGNVAVDPPFGDPARRVRRLAVTQQVPDDFETDVVAVKQFTNRRQFSACPSDGFPLQMRLLGRALSAPSGHDERPQSDANKACQL